MTAREEARRSCHYGRARRPLHRSDADIVREYGRGCKAAARVLGATYVLMGAMGAWLGW